jgi:hypothetical protein
VDATFARQVRQQAVQRARRARRQALLLLPRIVGVFVAYRYREHLDDSDGPQLADQVVAALSRLSADGQPEEEVATT